VKCLALKDVNALDGWDIRNLVDARGNNYSIERLDALAFAILYLEVPISFVLIPRDFGDTRFEAELRMEAEVVDVTF